MSASGATRALDRQRANIFGPLGGTTPSAPNIKTDAMFAAKAFDALIALVAKAAAKHVVDGSPSGSMSRWITSSRGWPAR